MKVYIGPYVDWIGPYQIADWLKKVGVSEDKCDDIGKWLAKTWLMGFCEWIHSFKKRKVKISIDDYDVWSMDDTLCYIIYPMLKRLQENKHGAPFVRDEDVPDGIGLRSTEASPVNIDYGETDDNFFKRWDWVLNEMIWSFEQLHDEKEDDAYKLEKEERDQYFERMHNGFVLFGKYFRALWD